MRKLNVEKPSTGNLRELDEQPLEEVKGGSGYVVTSGDAPPDPNPDDPNGGSSAAT